MDHWCTVEPGNPNLRVHRSSGKLGEASFPTGTVDPPDGISLSPLNTNDGFSLYTTFSYGSASFIFSDKVSSRDRFPASLLGPTRSSQYSLLSGPGLAL